MKNVVTAINELDGVTERLLGANVKLSELVEALTHITVKVASIVQGDLEPLLEHAKRIFDITIDTRKKYGQKYSS